MSQIILRDYQENAVAKAVWAMKLPQNDLLVLSTGAGKSIIIAEMVNRVGVDALILQPNKEIASQNISKLKAFVKEWEIGVFSASMNQKTVRKYTFATIGSIYKYPEFFAHFGLMIIDESHLVNPKNLDSMFTTFINAVNKIRKDRGQPPMKITGLTATPYRNMQGYHKDADGQLTASVTLKLINRIKPDFWKRILVNVGIGDLISQGYLCPLQYENRSFINHEDMKLNKSGTEFDLDNFAVKLGSRQQQVVDCVLDAQERFKAVLVFCPSVAAAEKYASVISGAAVVSAKTPADQRDRTIRDFKSGRIQTVFNMGVLTTGFDHPELDCIILLRPTRSLALYMQMLGRGVRIAEGKTHCTIIDWTNTVGQLGKVETVELRKEQFPEFQFPMWEIFSTLEDGSEARWHNKALYSFKITPKSNNYAKNRAIANNIAKRDAKLF